MATSEKGHALEKTSRKIRRKPGEGRSLESLADRKANAMTRSGRRELLNNIQERAENPVLNSGAGNICFNEIHGLQI